VVDIKRKKGSILIITVLGENIKDNSLYLRETAIDHHAPKVIAKLGKVIYNTLKL
jgi:hypothetical protein